MVDGSLPADILDPVIDEVRLRFIADFPIRCDTAEGAVNRLAESTSDTEALAVLPSLAHRLAGLAGVVGFRRVSTLASELEDLTRRACGGVDECLRGSEFRRRRGRSV